MNRSVKDGYEKQFHTQYIRYENTQTIKENMRASCLVHNCKRPRFFYIKMLHSK